MFGTDKSEETASAEVNGNSLTLTMFYKSFLDILENDIILTMQIPCVKLVFSR